MLRLPAILTDTFCLLVAEFAVIFLAYDSDNVRQDILERFELLAID
jgi:hypothetical protein